MSQLVKNPSVPSLGRSSGGGKGYPLQYPGLENSKDCVVPGFPKSLDTTERFSLLISGNSLWNKVLLRRIFQGLLEWSHAQKEEWDE